MDFLRRLEMLERVRKYRHLAVVLLFSWCLAGRGRARLHLQFPGPDPGTGQGRIGRNKIILENKILLCAWDISEGRLKPGFVTDKQSARTLQLREAECFELVLDGGQQIKAGELKIVGEPELENLPPNEKSCRLAEQCGGRQITVTLASPDNNLNVKWQAILRDGANYVRQQVAFTARSELVKIKEIVLLDLAGHKAQIMGSVDGSPVVVGNVFFGYEHPLSRSQIMQGKQQRLRCSLPGMMVLRPGEPLVQSAVIGVVPPRQLRRAFLYYIERERAQPYRPFLHYNSWYDIGYGAEKIQQQECLQVIELFGNELVKKRKVKMDSFALDDGWDDTASLWQFHKGFPEGFSVLQAAAEKYDCRLGAWLSPWGGYGRAKKQRLKYGHQQGFETNKNGFSLAGPKYYGRFRDVCVNMLRQYGLNYFKFDGIGEGGRAAGVTEEFFGDIQGLLRLIGELRGVKPDVFVNITTGTWPSPYWLWHGDSVWRAGADWGTHGWGSKRQQQITYRDKETYHNVVCRAPLYPLNSLMTQGIMFANHALPNETEGLLEDIHAFFACGTNCQELYITASLMQTQHWDALAEAARWSRNNADVLVDTHWVGADPAEGHIYGWAAWSRRKGILALRNPRDKTGKITIDIGEVFELPKDAKRSYSLKSPWKKGANTVPIVLSAGNKHTFELRPFEVLVFDATGF